MIFVLLQHFNFWLNVLQVHQDCWCVHQASDETKRRPSSFWPNTTRYLLQRGELMPIIIIIFPQMFCLYLQMPKDSELLSTFTIVFAEKNKWEFFRKRKVRSLEDKKESRRLALGDAAFKNWKSWTSLVQVSKVQDIAVALLQHEVDALASGLTARQSSQLVVSINSILQVRRVLISNTHACQPLPDLYLYLFTVITWLLFHLSSHNVFHFPVHFLIHPWLLQPLNS